MEITSTFVSLRQYYAWIHEKQGSSKIMVEEMPVKWMDRPSATEMERGCASEMDRQTKCHKNENAIEIFNIW